MTARCKFKVTSITDYGNDYKKFHLETQYDEKLSKEDRAFSNSTPTGNMDVVITNPNVFDIFKIGNYVYVDVSVVE